MSESKYEGDVYRRVPCGHPTITDYYGDACDLGDGEPFLGCGGWRYEPAPDLLADNERQASEIEMLREALAGVPMADHPEYHEWKAARRRVIDALSETKPSALTPTERD